MDQGLTWPQIHIYIYLCVCVCSFIVCFSTLQYLWHIMVYCDIENYVILYTAGWTLNPTERLRVYDIRVENGYPKSK